ncbi:Zn(2)-C6 fungal-type DNA-binding domain [Fusarium oxysporum f. sp. vasinfectum]|nr:Zn(2)-C6 fungal-type DNA-binding domain [Fusarium oxysporum f. sp. vasinfectum]
MAPSRSRYSTTRVKACQHCITAKAKCDRKETCGRCALRSLTCSYPGRFREPIVDSQHSGNSENWENSYTSDTLDFEQSSLQTDTPADLHFDPLDLVCPINSDDIKNRWLNSYVPLPGQSPKNYSQSVINFVYRMLKSYASTVIRGRLPTIHPSYAAITGATLNLLYSGPNMRPFTWQQRGAYEGIHLLGVFQAYLIYSMVLFFHLGPSMPFLRQAMINLQEIACATSREGLVCAAEQRGALPKWESWIMAEAKRRTLYIMYFLDNALSAHDGLTTYLGTCIAAFITAIMYCVTVFMMARYGAGYHAWEIRKPEYYNWLKWFYASTVVYIPAAFFTKATILLLMARVFAVEPRVAKGIKILIWALLVAYIPIQILRIVNCYPIRTYWDPDVRNARCVNQRKIFFSDLSLSIVTDLVILLIPIPLTWKLRMSIGKRIKIVLLLGAGGIATALTLFRVAKAVDFLNSDDITVDYTPISILTALEITIGFVCACLPSLNLLIEHHVRKRRRARNPNWPRDRTRTSLFKRRFRWISSSTEHMPSRPNRPSDGMIDLDVEMAMLTGQPVRLRTGRTASAGSHDIRPLDHRINSGDGRREGWLSQDQDEQDEVQDSRFIMRMVEESRARADEGAKESWCPVWDGPRDPMASQGSWKFSVRSH